MAKGSALGSSFIQPSSIHPAESENGRSEIDPDGFVLASHDKVFAHSATIGQDSIRAASVSRLAGTSAGDYGTSISTGTQALCLAFERTRLVAMSQSVIQILQEVRASSMRAIYAQRWRVLEAWCGDYQVDPFTCSAP